MGSTRIARAALVAVTALSALVPLAAQSAGAAESRSITFPVDGPVSFTDTFGACRGANCERRHEGIDLMGAKLLKLVAARDATVKWVKETATPDGSQGNYLTMRDAEGWEYWYIHINNDSPGTDDGANPAPWRFAAGIKVGSVVRAGQHVAYLGDSGNAEWTAPHLHFEIHRPDGSVLNPYQSLLDARARLSDPFDPARRGTGTSAGAVARLLVTFGPTGGLPLACDVDGDGGTDEVRVHGARWSVGGRTFVYGRDGDEPLCGDLDGDGVDTPAVRRERTFYARASWSSGPADLAAVYGRPDDIFLLGDWDRDRVDSIGVARSEGVYVRRRVGSGPADTVVPLAD